MWDYISRRLNLKALFLVSSALIAAAGFTSENRPAARNGILDLRSWDFENNGNIELNGEWEFYWKNFLPPDTPPEEYPSPSSLISVPGPWKSMVIGDETLSGAGYATYRLTILLPEKSSETMELALVSHNIRTSCELFVNGRRAGGSGTPAVDMTSAVPGHFPQITDLPLAEERMELILHVANFHHYQGGIWDDIVMGPHTEIQKTFISHISGEMVVLGCILVMGLYHFVMWIFRREDKVILVFSLYCLIIAARIFTSSTTHGFSALPDLAPIPAYNIGYLTLFTSLPVFFYYIYLMFPGVFHRNVVRIILAAGIILSVSVFVLSPIIFTRLCDLFEIFTVSTGLYLIYVLITALRRKLENARPIALGAAMISLSTLNDFLHGAHIISTTYIFLWGMLAFVLIQALLMSRRTISLLNKVERQTVERGRLIDDLTEAHRKFSVSRLGTILGLAKLAEYRDEDTGFHLERIREYCRILTRALIDHAGFKNNINEEYINDIYHSSILHDIGKVWVKDNVLLKQGRLTEEEFAHIRQHTTKGGDIIRDIERRIGTPTYLEMGREIAYSHHEKWDGSGYPSGLRNRDIALSARIVAVADVYDALTSKRPYKSAFSHGKAVSIIQEGRGTHFDPHIVDVFLKINRDFEKICTELKDHESAAPAS